jgi:hypothetical protein
MTGTRSDVVVVRSRTLPSGWVVWANPLTPGHVGRPTGDRADEPLDVGRRDVDVGDLDAQDDPPGRRAVDGRVGHQAEVAVADPEPGMAHRAVRWRAVGGVRSVTVAPATPATPA